MFNKLAFSLLYAEQTTNYSLGGRRKCFYFDPLTDLSNTIDTYDQWNVLSQYARVEEITQLILQSKIKMYYQLPNIRLYILTRFKLW